MKRLFPYLLIFCISSLIISACNQDNWSDRIQDFEYNNEFNLLNDRLLALEIENVDLLAQIQNLELKNEEMRRSYSSSNIINGKNTSIDEPFQLVDGQIEMYAQIEKFDGRVGKPAYGPIAELNPFAINIEKILKVVEEGEHFSKVQLEGYIPTWYLKKDQSTNITSVYDEKYVITDTVLYLSPNEDDEILRDIRRGRAAKVKYEFNDWYYVSLLFTTDACDFHNGWIKKSDTGNIHEFQSMIGVDIKLVEGSTAYQKARDAYGVDFEELWGYILAEDENTYSVILPGAYGLEANKSEVYFIGNHE